MLSVLAFASTNAVSPFFRRMADGTAAGSGMEMPPDMPCMKQCQPCDMCWSDPAKQSSMDDCYNGVGDSEECRACDKCDWMEDQAGCEAKCEPCWKKWEGAHDQCDPCKTDCVACTSCWDEAHPDPMSAHDGAKMEEGLETDPAMGSGMGAEAGMGSGSGMPEFPCSESCQPCDKCWAETDPMAAEPCFKAQDESEQCQKCNRCNWEHPQECEEQCKPCWDGYSACMPCQGECKSCDDCMHEQMPPLDHMEGDATGSGEHPPMPAGEHPPMTGDATGSGMH